MYFSTHFLSFDLTSSILLNFDQLCTLLGRISSRLFLSRLLLLSVQTFYLCLLSCFDSLVDKCLVASSILFIIFSSDRRLCDYFRFETLIHCLSWILLRLFYRLYIGIDVLACEFFVHLIFLLLLPISRIYFLLFNNLNFCQRRDVTSSWRFDTILNLTCDLRNKDGWSGVTNLISAFVWIDQLVLLF